MSRNNRKSAGRAGERPPAPEPLTIAVPDSHTHLDIVLSGEWGEDSAGPPPPDSPAVTAELDAATAAGIDRVVQVGVDVGSSRWGAELAALDDRVLAAVALHPNEAPVLDDLEAALAEIDKLGSEPRVRAFGETGLDSYRTGEEGLAAQEYSFRRHIEMAKAHGKALVIHDREMHEQVLRVLDDEGAPETVVLHCFSGDEAFARECVARGYFLSYAGNVTFKNAQNLRDAALVTPVEQMLVETDAPFLTPMPYRGRNNSPYLVPITVRYIAELKGVDVDELCAGLSATGTRVFGEW